MGDIKCSFCGAEKDEVEKLIQGPDKIAICDDCIMSCLQILVYGEDDTIEIELEGDDEDELSSTGC